MPMTDLCCSAQPEPLRESGIFSPPCSMARRLRSPNPAGLDSTGSCAHELIVRSRHLALGYWQDGHLQREILENAASSFMKSGDLLRLRDDGLAELVGRTSRLVKIRGQRVDPGE